MEFVLYGLKNRETMEKICAKLLPARKLTESADPPQNIQHESRLRVCYSILRCLWRFLDM